MNDELPPATFSPGLRRAAIVFAALAWAALALLALGFCTGYSLSYVDGNETITPLERP